MTDYEYLLHLIYSFVNGTVPQEKPDGVSFKNVLDIGVRHEVANIAFLSVEKLKNKPSQEVYEEWRDYYYLSVQRDTRQELIHRKTVDLMHENGIRTLEAQGTVTKRLYPSPELRMMTDIDFIIDSENLKKAIALMKERGYIIEDVIPGEFCAKIPNTETIEFHSEFFSEYMYNRKERFSDALNTPYAHAAPVEEGSLSYELEDTYFFLYSVLHIIKHFEAMGCGIRRVLDVFYLKKAFAGKLDEDVINEVIDAYGFREVYEKLFALEAFWFEGIEPETDITETQSDVLGAGVHGSEELFFRNSIRKDVKAGVKFARLKRLWFILFPSREYIFITYPECRERGYSTFRCRMYRIGAKLKSFNLSRTLERISEIIKSK